MMSVTASVVAPVVVVTVYFLWKRASQISTKQALAHLKDGALVIDVRSPAEFNSRHLPNAINLPVEKIETTLPRRVNDKNRVLLLHCQSGMRSGVAKTKLARLGYANAFNLGSYARAAAIVRIR